MNARGSSAGSSSCSRARLLVLHHRRTEPRHQLALGERGELARQRVEVVAVLAQRVGEAEARARTRGCTRGRRAGSCTPTASPTATKPCTMRRAVVVDERPVAVAKPGHHVDVGDRLGDARRRATARRPRAARAPPPRTRLGSASARRSSSSSLVDRVRDRERVVVAEEDRVLQVAEVGRGRADVRRRLGARRAPGRSARSRRCRSRAAPRHGCARRSLPATASDDERGPRASTTRSAAMPSTPDDARDRARARIERASPRHRARSSTPGSASTSRRSTHSNVVRRHASATSSSSPGRGRSVGERRRASSP